MIRCRFLVVAIRIKLYGFRMLMLRGDTKNVGFLLFFNYNLEVFFGLHRIVVLFRKIWIVGMLANERDINAGLKNAITLSIFYRLKLSCLTVCAQIFCRHVLNPNVIEDIIYFKPRVGIRL